MKSDKHGSMKRGKGTVSGGGVDPSTGGTFRMTPRGSIMRKFTEI